MGFYICCVGNQSRKWGNNRKMWNVNYLNPSQSYLFMEEGGGRRGFSPTSQILLHLRKWIRSNVMECFFPGYHGFWVFHHTKYYANLCKFVSVRSCVNLLHRHDVLMKCAHMCKLKLLTRQEKLLWHFTGLSFPLYACARVGQCMSCVRTPCQYRSRARECYCQYRYI